jgi:putative ABC transport system ATP-binding protein
VTDGPLSQGITAEKEPKPYRRFIVGQVWQQSGRNLLPDLSTAANVELPQMLSGISLAQRTRHAEELLELMGLGGMGKKKPQQLSGGEQQRVALARALAHRPRFIVADEPTGNLDSLTGRAITDLLRDICHQLRLGLLIATHDQVVVAAADHIVQIQDGRIIA